MEKATRIKLKDRTLENDIKFKGFLSYRYVKIIAWALLIIVQIGMVFKLDIKLNPADQTKFGFIVDIANFISDLPLPLFLLGNFALILQRKDNWRNLLLFYGGAALGMYCIANFVVLHFGFQTIKTLNPEFNFMDSANSFGLILVSLGKSGSAFNIFIDLFLCSLMYFFLNYTPEGGFKSNKKKIAFRLLSFLPIIYEIVSLLVRLFNLLNMMDLPFFFFFLLPSKPPMMFLAVTILIFLLKYSSHRQSKKLGKTQEEIENHNKTNAHSLRFSITTSIVFATVAILDIAIALGSYVGMMFASESGNFDAIFGISVISQLGFGYCGSLLLIVPIVMLFSYTKKHTNPKIDLFIPLFGIGLILIVYIEGIFQILLANVQKLIELLKTFLESKGS